VLCDGAMGTMLMRGAIFIKTLLRRVEPVARRKWERESCGGICRRGAEVIETNTCRRKRISSRHARFEDKVGRIKWTAFPIGAGVVNQIAQKQAKRGLRRRRKSGHWE